MSPNRQVTVQKRGANHTLHIVLTICTCGLWLPFWALAAMTGRKTKTITYGQQPQLPYQSTGYQVQQLPYQPQPGAQPYYPPQQAWPQAWEPQQPPYETPQQPYYDESYSQLQQQYPPQQGGYQPPQ